MNARELATRSLEELANYSRELLNAWGAPDVSAFKANVRLIRRALDDAEKVLKDDVYNNHP